MPILDPVKNTWTSFQLPVRDPQMPLNLGPGHAAALDPMAPSPYWARNGSGRPEQQPQLDARQDRKGLACRSVRGAETPAFCRAGSYDCRRSSSRWSARSGAFPCSPEDEKVLVRRHLLSTHHPQFGYDANDTLWTSGGGPVVGW